MSDTQASNAERSTTWLALGDSYTIGEGVNPEERWPTLLTQRLKLTQPRYIAQTGWTAGELLAAIEGEDLHSQYDWVSLLIGVNNQYRGLKQTEYRLDFEQLIRFAQSRVSVPSRILILSIPDYSVTPFGQAKDPRRISHEIEAYNVINYEIAQHVGCQYCNITPVSRQANTRPSLVANDDLHPSAAMYRLWAEQVLAQCRLTT